MLPKNERLLLENCIEAFNRLYDRDSSVVDVDALLFATAAALEGKTIGLSFEPALRDLRAILASKVTADQKRDLALLKTDYLCREIAQVLQRDAIENPKQRHHPKS